MGEGNDLAVLVGSGFVKNAPFNLYLLTYVIPSIMGCAHNRHVVNNRKKQVMIFFIYLLSYFTGNYAINHPPSIITISISWYHFLCFNS